LGRHKSRAPENGHAVLGARIRKLRSARGLTLKQLGERTGLSHAFLSQVERGLATPSFLTLADIARALAVSPAVLVAHTTSGLTALVRDTDEATVFGVPAADEVVARSLSPRDGLIKALVSEGNFELVEQMAHSGEELVYVISGQIEVSIGSERYALGPGDALTFDCSRPHAYRSLDASSPRFLVAVADPGAYAEGLDDSLKARGLTARP
jgi:transcriptional regulator with XRE-family HTH domain